MQLKPGLRGSATLRVGVEHTAAHVGSGRAPVLATPVMIALMEAAAVDCVEGLLAEGQETLGVMIKAEHIAATPIGVGVTAHAELRQIEGRTLTFDVEAQDERETIGKGTHKRVVVASAKFRAKAQAKTLPGTQAKPENS